MKDHVVYAAPSMEYLVVNDEQKTCGRHWPGDEFAIYELPTGWKVVGSISDLSSGECSNLSSQGRDSFYESCCSKLGYKYVAENNIFARKEYTSINFPGSIGSIVLGIVMFSVIIYLIVKRKVK